MKEKLSLITHLYTFYISIIKTLPFTLVLAYWMEIPNSGVSLKIVWLILTIIIFTWFYRRRVKKEKMIVATKLKPIEPISNSPEKIIVSIPEEDDFLKAKVYETNQEIINWVKTDKLKRFNNKGFNPNMETLLLANEIKLTNEERYAYLENELQLLKERDRRDNLLVQNNLNKALSNYNQEYRFDISTNWLKNSLAELGITKNAIEQVRVLTYVYSELIEEAEEYVEKELAIIGSGLIGESRVNEELKMYNDFWKTFSNVRFEVNGQSVETDALIVCTRGIFAIEVKNYSSNGKYSIQITKDGQWLKELSQYHLEPMNDVTSQHNRHIALKQRLINEELREMFNEDIPYIHLHPMIVIANDTVRIHNETDLPIIRISQIYHHVIKQPEILSPQLVNAITRIIKDSTLPSKEYPVKCYASLIRDVYDEVQNKGTFITEMDNEISNKYNKIRDEIDKR